MSLPWLQAAEWEFAERLAAGRLAHALLLSGPAESGKVELGRRFLAAALCLENRYPGCGTCRSCQLVSSGAHPDGHVLTFEPHPRTGKMRQELVVDQVRRLSSSLFLTNTVSRRKAALLFPAEAMNASTANALLKTLEEPPGEAVLILVSHAPARLPATIRSRCQRLEVRLPGQDSACEWMQTEHGIEAETARSALDAAAGSPLRALKMIADGGVESYALLDETLDGLSRGALAPPQAMAALAEVDDERLWAWLSLRAARETRTVLAAGCNAREAAELQRQADRNRRWTGTPVRKDLLLQDWLIQWAALNQ